MTKKIVACVFLLLVISCSQPHQKLEGLSDSCFIGLDPFDWIGRSQREVTPILTERGYVEKESMSENEAFFRHPTSGKGITLSHKNQKIFCVSLHWAEDKTCYDVLKRHVRHLALDGTTISEWDGIAQTPPDTTYFYSEKDYGFALRIMLIQSCCPVEKHYDRSLYSFDIFAKKDYEEGVLSQLKYRH